MKKSLCLLHIACGFVFFTLFTQSVKLQAASYTLIDLGTLGGFQSYPARINDSGQATGSSYLTNNTARHAFLYEGSSMQDIGTLGGAYSDGYGINIHGYIVGVSEVDIGTNIKHSFIYDGTTMHDIGTLGGTNSQAKGINDNGYVTGTSELITGGGYQHAYLYDGDTMQDLGTLGGRSSSGSAINNSGIVTGGSSISLDNNEYHAFIHDGSLMQDLGTLGGISSYGLAINNSGWVTGYSRIDGPNISVRGDDYITAYHAFLYDGNSMHDLGTLSNDLLSSGNGINDSGYIVGSSIVDGFGAHRAFLYDGNSMLDLCVIANCLEAGWTSLVSAYDINNRGDIVGLGVIEGQSHAFLAMASIPIPPALWLFSSGLLGLIGIARRKTA